MTDSDSAAVTDVTPIESPCVGICQLDEAGYCVGCCRSRQEIAAWTLLSPQERRVVMADLPRRLSSRFD